MLSWGKVFQSKVDAMEWDGREPFRAWFHGEREKAYGGEEKVPIEKDIPGGFTITEIGDGWQVNIDDQAGAPMSKRFPAVHEPR